MRWFVGIFILGLASIAQAQMAERSWELSVQGDDVTVEGRCWLPDSTQPLKFAVLWLPSEYGVLPEEERLAEKLSQKGAAVCIPNLFEALFLPAAPSSLQKIPVSAIAMLITQMQQAYPKVPFRLVTADRGASAAVKGWVLQQDKWMDDSAMVFINPNLYVATPEPGKTAQYVSEAAQLDAAVYIIQAELSPWRWRLVELADYLAQGGSDVWLQLLPKVRDRYYFRPDAMPVEQKEAKKLPNLLWQAFERLKQPRQRAGTAFLNANKADIARIPSPEGANDEAGLGILAKSPPNLTKSAEKAPKKGLKPYSGPQNLPLRLQNLAGAPVDLNDYRGKVVLLNFWASWCPPCVHEIPSMVALKQQMAGKPFEILAVNLAEPKADIQAFLQRHPVNFPVLTDPKGSAVRNWRVFAYPSSYLIDKQGRIRYALFGGFDWSSAEAVSAIQTLLSERHFD